MRVLCMLRVIREELGLTKEDLKRELGIDARAIDKLIADSDAKPWRLDREQLRRYFLFAHSHGFEPFTMEPNAIWKTFANTRAVIFRGQRKADVPVESHLVKYFERLNCEVETSTNSDGIEEAMKEHNCVIIGSPKANPACEIALAWLWKAEPFSANAKNRDRLPISFLGMTAEITPPSALLQESKRHGLTILHTDSKARTFLKVDWLPPEEYGSHNGIGQDAAILVGCQQPMGTEKNVTTIVIAGYTGLSTLVAAEEATYSQIPDLRLGENLGRPCLSVLKFRYRKRPQYKRVLDSLRTAEEGSSQWAPPWKDFFS